MSANKLVVVTVGKEITGVYISPKLVIEEGGGHLEVEVIDFNKVLAPWDEKTLELIDENKLQKII